MPARRREAVAEDPFDAIGLDDVVPIGSGGSSLVYRARQRAFDRLIAVKVLSMPLVDERSRRRFERELTLAGRLTGHPNVVTQFASGFFNDGRAYVAMEYCPGGSLADRLAASGPFPVRDVVSIGVKIAGVLQLAHQAGIVHRDVKPANVLVTRFGEPALADFGIAIVSGEMTGTTQALTPVHAAPEVLESRSVGSAADQWSLGSTLHTLLAGRAPFATEDEEGLLAGMLRILNDPVPAIPRSDVPERLRSVLARAMAKSPEGRWSDPAELGRALQEIERQEGWPVTNLPTEEVEEARYANSPSEPTTGEIGPPGSGLDPAATYSVPAPSSAPPVAPPPADPAPPTPSIWPTAPDPAPSGLAASGPAVSPSSAPTVPGRPTDGNTVRWERGSGPQLPAPPAPPSGQAPATGPAPGAPAGPPPAPPTPVGPVAGTAPSGESTQYWSRSRVEPPPITSGPVLARQGRNKTWWAVGGGAGFILLVVIVAVIVSLNNHPGKTKITKNTITPKKNTDNAASFTPVDLHIIAEQGTSVTLQWSDPPGSGGAEAYVVQVIDPANPGGGGNPTQTTQQNQTVVTGLQAGRAYCFTVGGVYAFGKPPAYAKEVCTAGANSPTTTAPGGSATTAPGGAATTVPGSTATTGGANTSSGANTSGTAPQAG